MASLPAAQAAAPGPLSIAAAPRPRPARGGTPASSVIWTPGVRLFSNLRFGAKAVVLTLAFLLPVGALVAWLVASGGAQALQARMDATRQHVEVAHGVIAWAHAQEAAGKLVREQAQKLAHDALGALRYDETEYFFVSDMQPRIVMHPIKPELDGKDASDLRDPKGLRFFQAFVDKVKAEKQGYVGYQWPKPGSEQPVDKISYVKGFEPWGWVVGSGVWIGDLQAARNERLRWVAAALVVALGFTGYLFVSFYRVIEGGSRAARRHLRAMAEGDLTTTPTARGRDESALIMDDLRAMQHALRGMVERVRGCSEQIVTSSGEIAGGAADLSARTEQTAANLEQTAASMEEIASAVKSSSDGTAEAARVALRNAEVAVGGGRVIGEVVQTMDGIRGSSARIGEIIGTIDAIAFQTNILALNAAVEAARAGDQGRGFAVVAGEVRALAQRAAAAAGEIKALIGGSVDQVAAGTATVGRATAAINDIVAGSERVSQLLAQVAGGAQEQSLGVAQVGQAVQELDRMTQQNAALVEQTAAAAASMRGQAQALASEVARFRLPPA